jgi:hypothetical protein
MKLLGLGQDFQEAFPIFVVLKNDPSLVPADRDVINRARKLHPEQPRHASDRIPNGRSLSIKLS